MITFTKEDFSRLNPKPLIKTKGLAFWYLSINNKLFAFYADEETYKELDFDDSSIDINARIIVKSALKKL